MNKMAKGSLPGQGAELSKNGAAEEGRAAFIQMTSDKPQTGKVTREHSFWVTDLMAAWPLGLWERMKSFSYF